jgi:endoglucanase
MLERATRTRAERRRRPLYVTAHLDHPAFVVRRRISETDLDLEFRGGVKAEYFTNAGLDVVDGDGRTHSAVLTSFDGNAKPFPRARARLRLSSTRVQPGDIARWALDGSPLPRVNDGLLYAPACDDLAGVAAALAAFDAILRLPGCGHVRLLFTRAEEVGFVGAIACCRARSIPTSSAVICLEVSRSLNDSPIGGGPVLRVGDRSGVFSARLTNQIGTIAARYAERRSGFVWQRKLMIGGTCEATAFTSFGYDATCLCLPLGNYHNMPDDGRRHKLAPEVISLADFHGLVDLLVVIARELHTEKQPFRSRMNTLFLRYRRVLERT